MGMDYWIYVLNPSASIKDPFPCKPSMSGFKPIAFPESVLTWNQLPAHPHWLNYKLVFLFVCLFVGFALCCCVVVLWCGFGNHTFGQMGGKVFFSPSASGKLLREFLAAGFMGSWTLSFAFFCRVPDAVRRKKVNRSPNNPWDERYIYLQLP